MTEPRLGDWVLTADGEAIGRIKRVGVGAFLLDVTGEPDFWLKSDDVQTVGEEVVRAVRMQFNSDELNERRIKYGA